MLQVRSSRVSYCLFADVHTYAMIVYALRELRVCMCLYMCACALGRMCVYTCILQLVPGYARLLASSRTSCTVGGSVAAFSVAYPQLST